MKFIAAVLPLFLIMSAYADTTWVNEGLVAGSWTADQSPFVIEGSLYVQSPDTLEIGPGVKVLFTGPDFLDVSGVLLVSGTADAPVHFTHFDALDAAHWAGIHLQTDTTRRNVFNHAIIELASMEFGDDGAVHVVGARVELNDCILRHNVGPAVFGRDGAKVTLSHCELHNNGVAVCDGGGGAIRMVSESSLIAIGCTVHHNHAGDGGAVYVNNSVADISESLFESNAACAWGGALYSVNEAQLTVSTSKFKDNWAVHGGAILNYGSAGLTVERCLFMRNTAGDTLTGEGGGVYALGDIETTLRNCTFVANAAASAQGSSLYGNDFDVRNCIFAYNLKGSAVHCVTEACSLLYCDFAGQENSVSGEMSAGFGFDIFVNANDDPCDYYRNIFLDPDFVDVMSNDVHLLPESPCIDAGDPMAPLDSNGSVTDLGLYSYEEPDDAGSPSAPLPQSFALNAYPNPFNSVAQLIFELPREATVKLVIYDVLGRYIKSLAQGEHSAGVHTIPWNAGAVPSGVYFAVLSAGELQMSQKLLLLR